MNTALLWRLDFVCEMYYNQTCSMKQWTIYTCSVIKCTTHTCTYICNGTNASPIYIHVVIMQINVLQIRIELNNELHV